VTRSGHFNPGFKEAPHAAQRVLYVLEGIASREGMGRAPQTMVRRHHVGVIGGEKKRWGVFVGRL
jgi:hypothetical protein